MLRKKNEDPHRAATNFSTNKDKQNQKLCFSFVEHLLNDNLTLMYDFHIFNIELYK